LHYSFRYFALKLPFLIQEVLNVCNGGNFRVLKEIGSRNTMVTSDLRPEVEIWPFRACAMKNMQYNSYYSNSSVIVDLSMGQTPRSTERISSYLIILRLKMLSSRMYDERLQKALCSALKSHASHRYATVRSR